MTTPLSRLTASLLEEDLATDTLDVADIVWLAASMMRQARANRVPALPPSNPLFAAPADSASMPADPQSPCAANSPVPDLPVQQPFFESTKISEPPEKVEQPAAEFHLPTLNGYSDGKRSSRSVKTPAAAALPKRLEIARALRPLMRRISSRTDWIIDEQRTIEQIAAGDVWWPVLMPAKVPRFQVALVIDSGISMAIWQQTALEFRRLLNWTGAFPNFRTYHLVAESAEPTITRKQNDLNGAAALRAQLTQAGAQSLVFVISDCVSSGWRNGSVFRLLESWAHLSGTCLIQVLPEAMWRRTALGGMPKIPLSNRAAAKVNRKFEPRGEDPLLDSTNPGGLRIPITDFTPEGFARLADLMVGGTSRLATGIVVAEPAAPRSVNQTKTTQTAHQRVELFRTTASPIAQRLAELIAVSPVVSLQVMRLIRRAMLPEAQQTHDAEFLLSGLVYVVRSDTSTASKSDRDIPLRFHDGVVDLLLDSTPTAFWPEVLDAVSRFVEPRLGRKLDGFRSLLVDPTHNSADFESLTEISNEPFLRIAMSRLARLGGDYTALANRAPSSVTETVKGTKLSSASTVSTVTTFAQPGASIPQSGSAATTSSAAQDPPDELAHKTQFGIEFTPQAWSAPALQFGKVYTSFNTEQNNQFPLPRCFARNRLETAIQLHEPRIHCPESQSLQTCISVEWAPASNESMQSTARTIEIRPGDERELQIRVDLSTAKQGQIPSDCDLLFTIELEDVVDRVTWSHDFTVNISSQIRDKPVRPKTTFQFIDRKNELENRPIQDLTPTLFIGLGGTGRKVLMDLRRRLLSQYRNFKDRCLGFLILDTDPHQHYRFPESYDEQKRAELRPDEFLYCPVSPQELESAGVSSSGAPRDRFQWIHPEFQHQFPSSAWNYGAATVRPIGRLAYAINCAQIQRAIRNHISELLTLASRESTLNVARDRLDVVLVTSLMGGTGSGMFLDMSFLVRDILRKDAEFRNLRAWHTTLIATLPSVLEEFDPKIMPRFNQNAYAALREMEYFRVNSFERATAHEDLIQNRDRNPLATSFQTHHGDKDAAPPWNTCYLVDNLTSSQNYASSSNISEQIARFLYLDLTNYPLSFAKRTSRSNFTQLTDRIATQQVIDPVSPVSSQMPYASNAGVLYEQRFSCSYSTFGAAEISLDRRVVVRATAYRLATKIIQKHWLRSDNKQSELNYLDLAKADLLGNRHSDQEAKRLPPLDHKSLTREMFRDPENVLDYLEQCLRELEFLALANPPTPVKKLNSYLQGLRSTLGIRPHSIPGDTHQLLQRRFAFFHGSPVSPGALPQFLQRQIQRQCSALGLVPALELLGSYHALFEHELRQIRERQSVTSPTIESLLMPLEKAERMLFPFRSFVLKQRMEAFGRQAREAVITWFFEAATPHLVNLYLELQKTLGWESRRSSGVRESRSLAARLELGRELLEQLAKQTSDEFNRLRVPSSRNQSLLRDLTDEEYDLRIVRSLVQHPDIGHDLLGRSVGFDMRHLDKLILRQLGKSLPNSPQGLSELLDEWLKIKHRRRDGMELIVEDLAQACQNLLTIHDDPDDRAGVVELLYELSFEDRERRIRSLVSSSTRWKHSQSSQSKRLSPAETHFFSCPNDEVSESGAEYVESLTDEIRPLLLSENREHTPDIKRIEGPPNHIYLTREVAGLPLFAFEELDRMKRDYEDPRNASSRKFCHIDWRLSDNLPEIMPSSQELLNSIGDHAILIVRAFVLERIFLSNSDKFVVSIPASTFGSENIHVGNQIEQILVLSSQNSKITSFLKRDWNHWQESATTAHWAMLACAIRLSLHIDLPKPNAHYEMNPSQNCLRKILEEALLALKARDKLGAYLSELLTEPAALSHPTKRTEADERLLQEMTSKGFVQTSPKIAIYQVTEQAVANLQNLLARLETPER